MTKRLLIGCAFMLMVAFSAVAADDTSAVAGTAQPAQTPSGSALTTSPSQEGSFTLLAPYGGLIRNTYADSAYGTDMKDTGAMFGLFAQHVSPKEFQANTFVYFSPSVNYSKIWGAHLNGDYYLLPTEAGKWAIGADIENISIHMQAGNAVSGLDNFDMKLNVLWMMLRGGRYVTLPLSSAITGSVFPYGGVAYERDTGEVLVDPRGRAPAVTSDIANTYGYPMWGTSLSLRLFHAGEVQLKYMGLFRKGGYQNSASAMLNVYLARDFGLSYRFKYMEMASDKNSYHLLGAVVVF